MINTGCFITAKSRPRCLIQNAPSSLQRARDLRKYVSLWTAGLIEREFFFLSGFTHAWQSFFLCGDSMAIYLTRYSMAFRAVFMQHSALAVWLFGCPVAFMFSSIINTLRAPINRLCECGLVSAPEISLSAVLLVDFRKLLKSCGAVRHATHCEGIPLLSS